MTSFQRSLLTTGCFFLSLGPFSFAADRPLDVVPSVDLNRYAGKWHEVARLPNWFEKACVRDTTATYTVKADGQVEVLNACKKSNGQLKSIKGTATVADKNGPNSKLKVTFFRPFSGKYWILALDPNYQWAIVGEPSREYLWILSRTPRLPPSLFHDLVDRAKNLGFDTQRLIIPPNEP